MRTFVAYSRLGCRSVLNKILFNQFSFMQQNHDKLFFKTFVLLYICKNQYYFLLNHNILSFLLVLSYAILSKALSRRLALY